MFNVVQSLRAYLMFGGTSTADLCVGRMCARAMHATALVQTYTQSREACILVSRVHASAQPSTSSMPACLVVSRRA